MSVPLSIRSFLDNGGCEYTTLLHPRAYTAQEEAAVTHTPGRAWAKTVVCLCDDEPVLAVLSADRKLDLDRLRKLAGAQTARLAGEGEFRHLYNDCEVGAMPPLGPLFRQRVFVDRSLLAVPDISFHGGTHVDGIRMDYRDFERLVRPVVGEFTWHV